ncbi:hypothetical protein DERF_011555 [Dermatophagoides farinae]|uniref:Uncharacterized protein n=1 Tax=Dermatophagoides farinae TaxID=6954 RepID=A0A922L0L3_DERFA|nr:hypothetical protein DERF_011555 [Dermatophagoides farinae]
MRAHFSFTDKHFSVYTIQSCFQEPDNKEIESFTPTTKSQHKRRRVYITLLFIFGTAMSDPNDDDDRKQKINKCD